MFSQSLASELLIRVLQQVVHQLLSQTLNRELARDKKGLLDQSKQHAKEKAVFVLLIEHVKVNVVNIPFVLFLSFDSTRCVLAGH